MKRAFISIFGAVFLVSSSASALVHTIGGDPAKTFKAGDMATVPDWTWVEVKNLDPIKNGNGSFKYGESCGIERGATVTVVNSFFDRVLVRYSINGTKYGSFCPTGVFFFTTGRTFFEMTAKYFLALEAEKTEKDLIRRLLKRK